MALVGLTAVRAAAVVAQAYLLARLIVRGFGAAPYAQLRTAALLLLGVVLVRALTTGLTELLARGASVTVREQVRGEVLEAAAQRGPSWLATPEGQQLPAVLGPGVDALDGYVGVFLPQVLAAMVVPPAVLLGVALADGWSLLVLALCLPLLPLFLALVGMHTRQQTDAQYRGLALMSEHFLDVVVGLPTLRSFGRARRQVEVLAEMAEQHRQRTMTVLRTAFLSSFVMELLATVSVALVAVSLGFRLLRGDVSFTAALTVLLLAPEAFLPVRAVGSAFHSGAGGLTAADAVDRALAREEQPRPPRTALPSGGDLELQAVTVRHPGRRDAALESVSLRVAPGETVVVTGESGAGKSTLMALLLGTVLPDAGRVLVGGVDLRDVDLDAWRQQISWVPQRPHLFAGTVEENILLARPTATAAQLWAAVTDACVEEFLADLPLGLDTQIGERGAGLSLGQARRIALARAFLRDAHLVLLDEPTADLDVRSEVAVARSLRLLCAGRTALITTHRAAPFLPGSRQVVLPSRALVPA